MRITPLEIQNHHFSKRLSGLDPDEVVTFLRMVAEDYESLMRENEVLHEKSVIILGIERLILPVMYKLGLHGRRPRGKGETPSVEDYDGDFPRWLHLLVPAALLKEGEFV